jgi:hypothetical protein
MAALEAGFKELVSDLIPAAKWLIENSPSPRIVTMIDEYFPQLPVRNLHNGTVASLPPISMEILHKGVQLRNRIAHTGESSGSAATVQAILTNVRDALWLFDFARGHTWALHHLSPELKATLKVLASAPGEEPE